MTLGSVKCHEVGWKEGRGRDQSVFWGQQGGLQTWKAARGGRTEEEMRMGPRAAGAPGPWRVRAEPQGLSRTQARWVKVNFSHLYACPVT